MNTRIRRLLTVAVAALCLCGGMQPAAAFSLDEMETIDRAEQGELLEALVGSFKPNRFGLYDVHGNVWELAADCWHESYKGAPSDSSSWTAGECRSRIVRGGSRINSPGNRRSANRLYWLPDLRNFNVGFRVARTLTP